MPVGNETMMDGTTLCHHCNTRFKITEAQLHAYNGMVRCGQCLHIFDARPGFVPDQPDPQLELPILSEPVADKPAEIDELQPAEAPESENPAELEAGPDVAAIPKDDAEEVPSADAEIAPLTLAEQIIVHDEETQDAENIVLKPRRWPWAVASLLLLPALLAQSAYFFRVELAARLPGLKPALIEACRMLDCSVPLPQNADLMGIESSELEADPAHENRITLNALLRNRASYPQAFPNLELTLNDLNDKPVARRVFRPADYLPPLESEEFGLLPHHEINVKLRLDTADLRPTGYRLALLYPAGN